MFNAYSFYKTFQLAFAFLLGAVVVAIGAFLMYGADKRRNEVLVSGILNQAKINIPSCLPEKHGMVDDIALLDRMILWGEKMSVWMEGGVSRTTVVEDATMLATEAQRLRNEMQNAKNLYATVTGAPYVSKESISELYLPDLSDYRDTDQQLLASRLRGYLMFGMREIYTPISYATNPDIAEFGKSYLIYHSTILP